MSVRGASDWFLRMGNRLFTHDSWHRVAYQPILYLFLWGAVVRIWLTQEPPIPFNELLSTNVETVWMALSLACPPMSALAWWLILKSHIPRSAYVGLWVRLASDIGQLTALLTYHLVTMHAAVMREAEVQIYFRYITGSTVLFVLLLVLRDVWALAATERLADLLRRS